ncbi:alpha/beta hydrolase [Chloroflexota bacterium]
MNEKHTHNGYSRPRTMPRREFLWLATASLLAACSPSQQQSSPTEKPTDEKPVSASTATSPPPTEEPKPTQGSVATASPTEQRPTPTPTNVVTDTPATTIGSRSFVEIYKTVNGTQLEAHIFLPPDHMANDARSAFVFFHGGGWFEGGPENGSRLCEYWATQGMVAIAFEYRLADFDKVTPIECVTDAKSAVRWIRVHATELGIDPDKIVVTGGSAGGHLAVSTAMLEGFEKEDEDLSIGSSPDAVIVWSAPVNLFEDSWFAQLLGDRADVSDLSPAHHIRPGLPPMAFLHGTDDETVPYWTIEQFVGEMQQVGNRCELYTYEGGGHLFHVSNRVHVLGVIEEFLISSGYIERG